MINMNNDYYRSKGLIFRTDRFLHDEYVFRQRKLIIQCNLH